MTEKAVMTREINSELAQRYMVQGMEVFYYNEQFDRTVVYTVKI